MGGKKTRIPGQNIFDPVGAFIAREFIEKRSPKSKRKPSGPAADPMMEYMSQMLAQQAAQAEEARKAQKQAFLESQKQSAGVAAQQGEMVAKQMLSQTGAMQQARDISAKEQQQKAYKTMGESAIGEGFDINQARQEQLANLSGKGSIPATSNIPFYGMNTGKTEQPASVPKKSTNLFALPEYQTIKFGAI